MSGARRKFPRRIEALEEIFAFLQDFAAQHGFGERTVYAINLVVEELFTNMVRHNIGGGDHIILGLDHDDEQVHLELVDLDVEPFDPTTVADVAVDGGIDSRRPGGLGVYLVKKLVDDVAYDYDAAERRMRISVKKSLEQ